MTKEAKPRTGDNEKLALDDVTVVIPVRIDSPDRSRNLELVLSWLESRFTGHKTLIVEHDVETKVATPANEHGADHVFLEADGCFHKSRVFNTGIALAETRFVLLYDCDVLFQPEALAEAAELLRSGRADCVYPYNGVMMQIRCDDSGPLATLDARCLSSSDVFSGAPGEHIPIDVEYLHGTLAEPSSGGALLCDRRTLILMGGLNENIISYGCEDTELETRLMTLGARVSRLAHRNCFHVHHRRGQDSHYNNFHSANLAEWKKVEAMSRAELARYVRNGFRRLRLDSFRNVKIVDDENRFGILLDEASGLAMDDTALAVVLPADTAFPPALVTALIDALEERYDNYELLLFELGGNHYRPVSHRDHVVYRSIEANEDWLDALTREADRAVLCLCTPFVDTSAEALHAAVDRIRNERTGACEIAAAPSPDPRTARLRETLAGRLPTGTRSFAFRLESFAARLANTEPSARIADAPGELAAAAETLANPKS